MVSFLFLYFFCLWDVPCWQKSFSMKEVERVSSISHSRLVYFPEKKPLPRAAYIFRWACVRSQLSCYVDYEVRLTWHDAAAWFARRRFFTRDEIMSPKVERPLAAIFRLHAGSFLRNKSLKRIDAHELTNSF